MTDENKAARALADRIISGAIDNAAPHPEAKDLIEHMVRNRTKVTDAGDLVVVDEQGVPRLSDRPGYPSLSLGEYLDELRATKPTLFANGKTPTCSGGPHTDPGNPFSRAGWNITAQMALMRSDPTRAAKLQAEASR